MRSTGTGPAGAERDGRERSRGGEMEVGARRDGSGVFLEKTPVPFCLPFCLHANHNASFHPKMRVKCRAIVPIASAMLGAIGTIALQDRAWEQWKVSALHLRSNWDNCSTLGVSSVLPRLRGVAWHSPFVIGVVRWPVEACYLRKGAKGAPTDERESAGGGSRQ